MRWKATAIHVLSRLLRPGITSSCAAAFFSAPLKLASPRRDVAARNLRIALPSATEAEISRIVGETYSHMIWTAIEFIVLQRDPKQVLSWVECEGASRLDDLHGHGAILITSHVGNWELTAAYVAQLGHDITAIVRESDDAEERGVIEEMRERCGVRLLPKTAQMTRSVSILRRGEFLGILPDQHEHGPQVPLFGIPTATATGPAVFAYLTKKPIVPVFTRRIEPFRHAVRIGAPIEWEPLGSRDETILDITARINGEIERMIREAPGQWLAQHRRFREIEDRIANGGRV